MKEVNSSNFEAEVLQSDVPVVVDFWAPWCVPCKKIQPVVEELSSHYDGKVKFVKVNIEEAPDLASSYMVMSIPTLLLFKGGTPCEKKSGVISRANLDKFIFSHLQ